MKVLGHRKVPSGSNILTETLPTTQLRRSWFKILLLFGLAFTLSLLIFRTTPPQVTIYFSPISRQLEGHVEFFGDTTVEIHTKVSTDFSRFAWFNSSQRYVYNYTETIQPVGSCEKLRFLFVVASALGNFEQRKAVRDTWGMDVRDISGGSKLVFLLGSGKSKSILAKVQAEASQYGDILQYTFNDTYRNATTKSIMMLKWAANCHPKYLVKSDDDMMINIMQLRKKIETLESVGIPFIAGSAHFGKGPIREKWNKWFVSKEEYPDNVFPDYVGGSLYVITGSVIGRLYEEALKTTPLSMEDVFITGFLGTKLGLPRVGLEGISTWAKVGVCDFHDYIGSHYATPAKMRLFASSLRFTRRYCKAVLFGMFHMCRCIPYIKEISV